jgi:hypothetical protein
MSRTKAVGVRIEIDVLEEIKQLEPYFVLTDFVRCALQEHKEKLIRDRVREANERHLQQERMRDIKCRK